MNDPVFLKDRAFCYNRCMKNLIFNPYIAQHKPSNKDECPFCLKKDLGAMLGSKDDILWLENKYPTMENAYQTLIIESDHHLGDVSNYDLDHLKKLFHYALEKWHEMEKDPRFKSVIFFKNFGPMSGGSLRHPHMQIVGLEEIDAYEKLEKKHFQGLTVLHQTKDHVELNLSLDPISGYTEFNLISSNIDHLAVAIQEVTAFLLEAYFSGKCDSYNLFFYHFEQTYVCKVLPRFVTSPYFLGYMIAQRHNLEFLSDLKQDFIEFRKNRS